jgi:hypothetical protein
VGDVGLAVTLRSAAVLALGALTARWLAMELAAYAGHRILPPGPPPRDSPRAPGHMPGPFDARGANRWNE